MPDPIGRSSPNPYLAEPTGHSEPNQTAASTPPDISTLDEPLCADSSSPAVGQLLSKYKRDVGAFVESQVLDQHSPDPLQVAPVPASLTAGDLLLVKTMAHAERIGLPTRLLDNLGGNVRVDDISGAGQYRVESNVVVIDTSIAADDFEGEDLVTSPKPFAMNTLFHEATHREDHLRNLAERFVGNETGVTGTAGAQKEWLRWKPGDEPTNGSERTRAVREAIGLYVGHRVDAYAHAFERLAAGESPDDVRKEYDEAMLKRKFGYWGSASEYHPAAEGSRIPDLLKQQIDQSILDGKVPDRFDDVEAFKQIRNCVSSI